MQGKQEGHRPRHRSALRSHPLTQERRLADQVARGIVPEDGVRVIVDVDEHGNPIYADSTRDALVELMMTAPVRSRTRPRARFGSR